MELDVWVRTALWRENQWLLGYSRVAEKFFLQELFVHKEFMKLTEFSESF